MEPRGVVATYQAPDNELVVWNSTQQPHGLRTLLANMLRVPENRVRVIAPEVGGGFGSENRFVCRRRARRVSRQEDRQAGEVDRGTS
jgi:carbon-monoxide dehydrogenase large subunit